MTSQGHALTRLQRALERGTANQIRAIVAELPRPPGLEDALAICLALLDREPETYPRAAAKWASRFAIERRLTLTDAQLTLAALQRYQAREHVQESRPSLSSPNGIACGASTSCSPRGPRGAEKEPDSGKWQTHLRRNSINAVGGLTALNATNLNANRQNPEVCRARKNVPVCRAFQRFS